MSLAAHALATARTRDGAHRLQMADHFGELRIGVRLSARNRLQSAPHSALKWRSAQVEVKIEYSIFTFAA